MMFQEYQASGDADVRHSNAGGAPGEMEPTLKQVQEPDKATDLSQSTRCLEKQPTHFFSWQERLKGEAEKIKSNKNKAAG